MSKEGPPKVVQKILSNYHLLKAAQKATAFFPQVTEAYGSSVVTDVRPWQTSKRVEQVITSSGVWCLAPKGRFQTGERVELIRTTPYNTLGTILVGGADSLELYFLRKWECRMDPPAAALEISFGKPQCSVSS